MDITLQKTFYFCLISLFSRYNPSEPRLVYSHGSSSAPKYTQLLQVPPAAAAQQQQSPEISVHPRPVLVRCHPDSMEVVVQADLFDTGLQVDGRYLRLGRDPVPEGSPCRAVPSGEAEFSIRALLLECGTKLSSTTEKIIYSTSLVYSPEASDGLLRLDGATIPVECHYDKKCAVDSVPLQPQWVPLVSITSAVNQMDFSLRLMTEDWQFLRGSSLYFLGDPMNLEVSAIVHNHLPLRVFIDRCVATATADAEASLKYVFIEHGCLTDAYLTDSNSHFLARVEEHKLRFQMDAFRFHQEPTNQVYITCYMKAVPVSSEVSSQSRACSLINKRWRSVDGNDQACRSCDVFSRFEEPAPTQALSSVLAAESYPAQESLIQHRPEQKPPSYIRFNPVLQQSPNNQGHQSPGRLMKRETGDHSEKAVQLGPLTVLPSDVFVSRTMNLNNTISPKSKTP